MLRDFKDKTPKIGKRNYIDETSVVIGGVYTEENVSIWPGAVLRADIMDIKIGNNSNIQDNCVLHGYEDVIVGENVTVGHNVILHGAKIGNNVLVGMGSTLLDDCVIGDNSIVGANSLVTGGKKFPPNSLIMGSPAKVVRQVTDEELDYIKSSCDDYLNLLSEVL